MKRGVVLGIIVALSCLPLVVSGFQAPSPAALAATKIEKVKDNLYVISGSGVADQNAFSGGNTAVFVTDSGVVVVDTKLPGWGPTLLERIKTVTNKPVTTIINTHTMETTPAAMSSLERLSTVWCTKIQKRTWPGWMSLKATKRNSCRSERIRTHSRSAKEKMKSTCTILAPAIPVATASSCSPPSAQCTSATCLPGKRCPTSIPETAAAPSLTLRLWPRRRLA